MDHCGPLVALIGYGIQYTLDTHQYVFIWLRVDRVGYSITTLVQFYVASCMLTYWDSNSIASTQCMYGTCIELSSVLSKSVINEQGESMKYRFVSGF